MYICPKCQNTSETPVNFCAKCGTPMVEKAPEAEPAFAAQPVAAPAEDAPAYAQAQTPAQPSSDIPAYAVQPQFEPAAPAFTAAQPTSISCEPEKKVPLGKVIAGMALSIGGVVMASLAALVTLATLAEDAEIAFGMSIVYGGFFGFPLSLVGLILSKGAVNAGSKSSMAKVGKILGLVGVILSAVSLGLGFIGLMSEM